MSRIRTSIIVLPVFIWKGDLTNCNKFGNKGQKRKKEGKKKERIFPFLIAVHTCKPQSGSPCFSWLMREQNESYGIHRTVIHTDTFICINCTFWKLFSLSLHHRVKKGSGAHPASYSMAIKGSFPGGKVTGAWSWPLTSI